MRESEERGRNHLKTYRLDLLLPDLLLLVRSKPVLICDEDDEVAFLGQLLKPSGDVWTVPSPVGCALGEFGSRFGVDEGAVEVEEGGLLTGEEGVDGRGDAVCCWVRGR
jgi:hypothetical protein